MEVVCFPVAHCWVFKCFIHKTLHYHFLFHFVSKQVDWWFLWTNRYDPNWSWLLCVFRCPWREWFLSRPFIWSPWAVGFPCHSGSAGLLWTRMGNDNICTQTGLTCSANWMTIARQKCFIHLHNPMYIPAIKKCYFQIPRHCRVSKNTIFNNLMRKKDIFFPTTIHVRSM